MLFGLFGFTGIFDVLFFSELFFSKLLFVEMGFFGGIFINIVCFMCIILLVNFFILVNKCMLKVI